MLIDKTKCSSEQEENTLEDKEVMERIQRNKQVFKANLRTLVKIASRCRGGLSYPNVELVLAIYNFDLFHSSSPYSEELKSTFHNLDEYDPLPFVERVDELHDVIDGLVAEDGDDILFQPAVEAALALHKDRVAIGGYGEIHKLYHEDSLPTYLLIPSTPIY